MDNDYHIDIDVDRINDVKAGVNFLIHKDAWDKVTGLTERLRATLAARDERITDLVGKLAISEAVNKELGHKVYAANERIATLEAKAENYMSNITVKDERIAELEATFAKLGTAEEIYKENDTLHQRIATLEDDLAIKTNAYSVWYKRCVAVEAERAAFKGSHRDLVACVIEMADTIATLETSNNDLVGAGRMIDGVCEVLKQVGYSEYSSKPPSAYVRDLIAERDKLRGALRPIVENYEASKSAPEGLRGINRELLEQAAVLLGDGGEVRDE